MKVNLETIDPQIAESALLVLDAELSEQEYTAYGIHTVLNRILVANGTDKIRPQMMYNYLRNGLVVKGQKIFGESLRNVTKEEAASFLMRYCLRNGIEIRFTKSDEDPNQLELDLEI